MLNALSPSSKIFSGQGEIFSPLYSTTAKRLAVKGQGHHAEVKQISLQGRQALADRIRQGIEDLRKRRGKTSYAEIAQRSGNLITEGAISNLLSKKVGNPAALTLFGLAKALELPPNELFNAALEIREPVEPEGFGENGVFYEAFELYKKLAKGNHRLMAEGYLRDLNEILRMAPKKDDTKPSEPLRRVKG